MSKNNRWTPEDEAILIAHPFDTDKNVAKLLNYKFTETAIRCKRRRMAAAAHLNAAVPVSDNEWQFIKANINRSNIILSPILGRHADQIDRIVCKIRAEYNLDPTRRDQDPGGPLELEHLINVLHTDPTFSYRADKKKQVKSNPTKSKKPYVKLSKDVQDIFRKATQANPDITNEVLYKEFKDHPEVTLKTVQNNRYRFAKEARKNKVTITPDVKNTGTKERNFFTIVNEVAAMKPSEIKTKIESILTEIMEASPELLEKIDVLQKSYKIVNEK